MTKDQVVSKVRDYIDSQTDSLDLESYIDFLELLIADLEMKITAAKSDLAKKQDTE